MNQRSIEVIRSAPGDESNKIAEVGYFLKVDSKGNR
jgi:hypothetical protein